MHAQVLVYMCLVSRRFCHHRGWVWFLCLSFKAELQKARAPVAASLKLESKIVSCINVFFAVLALEGNFRKEEELLGFNRQHQ
jgi:hypothetical protein